MANKDRYILPLIFLILIDAIVFGGSIVLSQQIVFGSWLKESAWIPLGLELSDSITNYWSLAFCGLLICMIVQERFGFYRYWQGLDRGIRPIAFILAVAVSYIFLMAWLFIYGQAPFLFPRTVILLSLVLTVGLGLLSHWLLRIAMSHLVDSGIGFIRTLFVGTSGDSQSILERLYSTYGSLHQIIGLVELNQTKPENRNPVPVLGTLDQIPQILNHHRIDRVIVALPDTHDRQALDILQACREQKLDCRFIPELFDTMSLRIDVEAAPRGLPTISLGETPMAGMGELIKRLMDVLIASVAMVVASPFMALFGLLVKLDSGGPILYTQERIGSDGTVFTMYKFRTMYNNAEKQTGPVWAKANDPRCTRFGHWLRRMNLDELPQLINVFRGEMSLVGPRPERPYFVNQFKQSIPKYMRRHMVRSGVTGWAQVNGLRGNTSVEERTKYDIFYVENWSILFDLRILLRTLFSNKNAY